MGAQAFHHTINAETFKEGYNILYEEAICEYGSDPYSGTIATCDCAARPSYKFDGAYKESNMDKALKMIEDEDYGEKWLASFIDLGVVEYKVIKPKKTNKEKSNPKYKIGYTVRPSSQYDSNSHRGRSLNFNTKTEAVNKAMELSIEDKIEYNVYKEYVLVEGNPLLTTVELEAKSYKTKPKKVPQGCRLVEVHKYIFYGWAAC